ncbi:Beta-1,3-galactosyltransferase 5 [Holothuria leucospilota]|uniref:Hexosyltransferase n=1 Tax=Holothuria leucospilota TaxID=206669 RepID=A0A9Q1HBA8_HOLLE|nr:Beta-1,3-galactosyltransferase 5 [Holothuria leucospilota]
MFYPSPKIFPVPIIRSPNVENCPKDKPFILIIVVNMADQSGHRNSIRRSWAKQTNFKPVSLRNDVSWWVVFSIGTVDGTEDSLKKEQENYGDLLQGDFPDHPSEETRKTLLGFKWAAEQLPASCQPLLVLKTECTVFVNTPLLTKWITDQMAQNTGIYAGKVIRGDVPIRDLRMSLQVPELDYPRSTFPPFVQGPCYLLSMDVLTTMLTLVRVVTPIAMEDAYIGLLAEKMDREPQNYDNFQVINRPKNQCHYLEMLFIKTGKATVHHQIFMVVNHQKEECLDKKDL